MSLENQKFPIAEIFDSVQGEGRWCGLPMHFIRFAGCNVGRAIPENDVYERCTAWDGRTFLCDTNYKRAKWMNGLELLKGIPNNGTAVCFTGGEPFLHDLSHLAEHVTRDGHRVHVETSGTRELTNFFARDAWVCVSPKQGCLPRVLSRANEIKFLVDQHFDLGKADWLLAQQPVTKLVYLSPINGVDTIDQRNLELCLDILKKRPKWQLTTQMHKIWGLR